MSIKVGDGGVDHDISVIDAAGTVTQIAQGIAFDAAGVQTTFYVRYKEVIIDGTFTAGINLDDLYEAQYGIPEGPVHVKFIIQPTCKITDNSTTSAYLAGTGVIRSNNWMRLTAFWYEGTTFRIENNSSKIGIPGGKGGNGRSQVGSGGVGTSTGVDPSGGYQGTGFLYSLFPVELVNNSTVITGGGGGAGGDSDYWYPSDIFHVSHVAGGGGGAGGMRTGELVEVATPTVAGGFKGRGVENNNYQPAWDGTNGSSAISTYGANGGIRGIGNGTGAGHLGQFGGDGGYRGMRGHPAHNNDMNQPVTNGFVPGEAGALFFNGFFSSATVNVIKPGIMQGRAINPPTVRAQNNYFTLQAGGVTSISYTRPTAALNDLGVVAVHVRYSGTLTTPTMTMAGHTFLGHYWANGTYTAFFSRIITDLTATSFTIGTSFTFTAAAVQGWSITAGTFDATQAPIFAGSTLTTTGPAKNKVYPDLTIPTAWGLSDGLFMCTMANSSTSATSATQISSTTEWTNYILGNQAVVIAETHLFKNMVAGKFSPGQAINTVTTRSSSLFTLGIKGISS